MWAIVVAAGIGTRFGGTKQLAALAGRPMAAWCVEAARSVASKVVLVLPEFLVGKEEAGSLGADIVVPGGSTRSGSVRNGLACVPEDVEIVVVHDGARPLASAEIFEAVVAAVADGADAAVPGVEVTDTLKRVRPLTGAEGAAHGPCALRTAPVPPSVPSESASLPMSPSGTSRREVVETLDRSSLVAVQTPQAFWATKLRLAHASQADATDDAGLVEAIGATVQVVPGDPANLKVTVREDLVMAEALMASRSVAI